MIKEKIKYSKYQERIFDEILNTNNNIVVKATAGSGKTFTAIEASKLLYTNQDIIFLAFNKSIIEELRDKLPSHIQCQTIHSLGLASLISFYKTHLRLNEYKSFMFFEKYLKKLDKKQKFTKFFLYKEALDLIRLTLTNISCESIMQCCLYYDIYLEDEDISNLILIYKDMEMYNFFLGKENNQIDYVDMIHLPVTQKRIKLQKFDTVIIDELQDMNRTQQEFIKNIIKPTGRFIGIGDDKQCIYSFIGADRMALKTLRHKENLNGLHNQTMNIQINNFDESINSYDMNKLTYNERKQLKQILDKVSEIKK
jgi:superfamily I DNA/RNA helicase